MRIIGVDPGSRKTGFGIIEVVGDIRKIRHINHGVLRLDVDRDIGERMRELAHRLREIIVEYQPTHCALEDIFVSEGLRSALMLGQARGAVLATMGLHNIPVNNFAPTKVKLALTGTGRAEKIQVSKMVQMILGVTGKLAEDAGDALAIAICCANQSTFCNQTGFQGPPTQKRLGTKKNREALADIARRQGRGIG